MSREVLVASEDVRLPLPRALAAAAVEQTLRSERVPHAMISVAFVTNRAIARINRDHLGRRGATDVISFGFRRDDPGDPVIGDIYIAPDVARANAREAGTTLREEVVRLLVHGTLHVLGYDHPETAARTGSEMWSRQERLVTRVIRGVAAR